MVTLPVFLTTKLYVITSPTLLYGPATAVLVKLKAGVCAIGVTVQSVQPGTTGAPGIGVGSVDFAPTSPPFGSLPSALAIFVT
ncbi:hypothetical protein D3C79_1011660 [compost metagenome]